MLLGRMMHQSLSIGSLIDHAARYHAGTEIVSALTEGGFEHTTWGEVGANAHRIGSALIARGMEKGDRIGTLAWNNRRHLELYFGVPGMGMVCHTVNPRLSPEQMAYIVNHAGDRMLFIEKTFVPLIAKLRDQLTTLRGIVLLGGRDEEAAAAIPGLLFHDELLAEGDPNAPWPDMDETTPSSLCYTSGTTGNPKGVLYTHRSTLLHGLAVNNTDGLAIGAADSVMPVVPMFHVNAWGIPYAAAAVGARLVLPGPRLDGDSLAHLIVDEGVTMAAGVPTIWLGLLHALDTSGLKPVTLKRTVVGGSALPPSMRAAFRDRYGVELIHAWGMSETSPLGTLNAPLAKHGALPEAEQDRIGNGQGRPPYGVELRIVGADGLVLPSDGQTEGELQILRAREARPDLGRLVRHRRHRDHRPGRLHGDPRPVQGHHQVGGRVDLDRRSGEHRRLAPQGRQRRRHRRAAPEMGRAPGDLLPEAPAVGPDRGRAAGLV